MQPMEVGENNTTLVSPKVISVTELATARLDNFPIIVLNDVPRLPRELVLRLQEYTQKGHGLWIILGPRTDESFLNGTLAKSPLFPATASKIVSVPTTSAPVEIDIKEPENPAMALVTAAQRNALAGATVRAWWPIKPNSAEMRTILATTTGDPLAMQLDLGKSGGRVIVWTSAVSDLSWSNLPVVPNFVPLVNETLFHLASGQAQSQLRQLDAGAALVWSGPAHPPITSATLTAPDGSKRAGQPQLVGDKYILQFKDVFTPGLYELRFTPTDIPQPVFYSVNVDKAEFDPTTVTSADIEWLNQHKYLKERVNFESLRTAINAQRSGLELWWMLGLALLLLLITEVIMTWRLARKQTDVDVEHAGLIKPSAHPVAKPQPAGSLR
jgi:hypothetical protein